VGIQKELKGRNEELPKERRMPIRIGIHLGDIIEEEGKIYGDGVNVAALLDSLADGGGICVSRSAHDQVKNKLDVGYQDLGQHGVETIAEPVRVYRVVLEPDPKWKMIGKTWSRMKRWQKVALTIGIALFQVGGGLVVKKYFDRPPSPPVSTASVQKAALPFPDKPSIAVLPFENMTGDPKQEYFADGFTEQIITSLSKISSLFVISRNSTFTYKGKPVKVQQVSEELGVRYVLEGSVQKISSRIRINVQLIDAISGRHLWAESYDRDLKDIFGLQDEVILKITSAMSVNLTAGEQARAWAEGTKSLEAYLKFMQGREYLRGNRESNALARRLAEETIALDPKYANAYALLGATHWKDVYLGTSRPKESIAKAIELTQKALAMNGSLADARSRLGVLYSWSGRYDEGIGHESGKDRPVPFSADRPPETVHRVVVHHPHRLHVGVADGAADEAETAPLQIPAQGVRYRRADRYLLHAAPTVLDRPAFHEAPLIGIESAELFLHFQKCTCIGYGRCHLQAIADDAGVGQEFRHRSFVETGHFFGVEAAKGGAIGHPFAQDGDPGEPGLGTFQDQEFEQEPVVVDRHAPFLVMVGLVEWIAAGPGAAVTRCSAIHRFLPVPGGSTPRPADYYATSGAWGEFPSRSDARNSARRFSISSPLTPVSVLRIRIRGSGTLRPLGSRGSRGYRQGLSPVPSRCRRGSCTPGSGL
jgi:TolB-like protein